VWCCSHIRFTQALSLIPGKPGLGNGLGYNIPRLTALVPSRVKDLHGFRLHL